MSALPHVTLTKISPKIVPTLSVLLPVNHITKTAFFDLRNIARLQPSLSPTAAETLIHSFVTSRLDYSNSILFGATNKVLHKLQ